MCVVFNHDDAGHCYSTITVNTKIIDMFGSNSYPNDIIILIGLAIGIGVLYWIGNSAKRYIILLLQNEIYATTIKQMLKNYLK